MVRTHTDAVADIAQTTKPRRGELRIYLGAAPGVGKTYDMLCEAHRRGGRGADVVIALVETHGRRQTAELLDGLETLPRKRVVHRGVELTELDVDAVLARRPEVAIVDELAHTNVPGSRNAKRWHDINELLDAGITVLSTVNVQHLESLNDVVQRITGIQQQETVPDEVVRNAEQVELVDITPEALRLRMADGNIYPAGKVDAALGNYFRQGNLTALRELALLWVADQADVALQRHRTEHEITDTAEPRERVVVAITGGPESETLIRRAHRVATRADATLLVVHVLRGDNLANGLFSALAKCRKLADQLGATFHTVVGADPPTALLHFARGVNATQLVLGTSRRSRLARLFDEGIGAITVQESGPIDVHMVTHDETQRALRWRPLARSPLAPSRQLAGWILAVVAPAAATVIGTLGRQHVAMPTDLLGYFLATVMVALVGGLRPALLTALLSGGLLNFFFTPPLYSLEVAATEHVVTLVAMMIVAVVVAFVVDQAARRAEQATAASAEAELLASYSRTVLSNPYSPARLLKKVRENFGLASVALLERRDGRWERPACVGPRPCQQPDEADVDIAVTADVHLSLRGRPLPATDRRVLEAAAGQALLALRQQRMVAETANAQRRAATTELHTALLSSVGHELRIPLTALKAATGSLRDPGLHLSASDTDELLAIVEESADRLAFLGDNLLDSSRLATGAVQPQLSAVDYHEVVARVMTGINDPHLVDVTVDENLPPVLADHSLLERVIANLVDNALRHRRRSEASRSGPAVAVRASAHADQVALCVVDHGPGLPSGAADRVFASSQGRATPYGSPGAELGVAKGFTEAMGGRIHAEETPGAGLTIVISLPAYHQRSS